MIFTSTGMVLTLLALITATCTRHCRGTAAVVRAGQLSIAWAVVRAGHANGVTFTLASLCGGTCVTSNTGVTRHAQAGGGRINCSPDCPVGTQTVSWRSMSSKLPFSTRPLIECHLTGHMHKRLPTPLPHQPSNHSMSFVCRSMRLRRDSFGLQPLLPYQLISRLGLGVAAAGVRWRRSRPPLPASHSQHVS